LALLSTSAQAATHPQQHAMELQQVRADYAQACAGKPADTRFTEADGTLDEVRTAKGQVIFYRESTPESGDWSATDMYIFSAATGKRLQFTRAVTYAAQIFVYVKTIDAAGHVADNAHVLPAGWYQTDEPIFSTLKQVCHFAPAKAGHE